MNRWLATGQASRSIRLRAIQIGLVIFSIAAFIPWNRINNSPKGPNRDLEFVSFATIVHLIPNLVLFLNAVAFVIQIRRMKYGFVADTLILGAFLVSAGIIAIVLAANLMVLVLPIAILATCLYGIFASEQMIRDLKLTMSETDMST